MANEVPLKSLLMSHAIWTFLRRSPDENCPRNLKTRGGGWCSLNTKHTKMYEENYFFIFIIAALTTFLQTCRGNFAWVCLLPADKWKSCLHSQINKTRQDTQVTHAQWRIAWSVSDNSPIILHSCDTLSHIDQVFLFNKDWISLLALHWEFGQTTCRSQNFATPLCRPIKE